MIFGQDFVFAHGSLHLKDITSWYLSTSLKVKKSWSGCFEFRFEGFQHIM
jgi:hypothetical protein